MPSKLETVDEIRSLEKALANCNQEPIQYPNSIQSHGYLLVLDNVCQTITRASKNITEILDVSLDVFLGSPASDVLPDHLLAEIAKTVKISDDSHIIDFIVNDRVFDLIYHKVGEEVVVEIEEKTRKHKNFESEILDNLEGFCAKVLQTDEVSILNKIYAQNIRKVAGFDRVKIYKFDSSWNGKVVAEEKEDFMSSYLGLHFPASDIPPIARELYKKNLLRIISNTEYRPVPIVSKACAGDETLTPLNMSKCVLRSVSPVHLRYLQNMQVAASMSISIMLRGELWGMLVNHHSRPRNITYRLRLLCEVMTHIYAARLEALLQQLQSKISNSQQQLLEDVSKGLRFDPDRDVSKLFHQSSLDVLDADGLVICKGKEIITCGITPKTEDLRLIRHWLYSLAHRKVVVTEDLRAALSREYIETDLEGGALVVPLGFSPDHFALWYRQPVVKKVEWAGKPHKEVEKTDDGYRLNPRSSFELWKAEVKHECREWEMGCVQTAESIAQLLLDSERNHAEQVGKLKTQFLSEMSHELRTPLTAMNSIIQILKQEESLQPSVKSLINTLGVSAESLMSLINDVIDLEQIDTQTTTLEMHNFSPKDLIEEIRSVMTIHANEKGLALNVNYGQNTDAIISSDALKLRKVLFNLVGNAIKYTPKGFVNVFCSLDEIDGQAGAHQMIVEVADSGVGIPEDKLVKIFDRFEQAHHAATHSVVGSGLGLSICRSLIDVLGGEITVASKLDMGSKFTVTIPVKLAVILDELSTSSPSLPTDQVIDAPEQMPHRDKKVLLAEDYEGNTVAITYFLQHNGCNVVIASNGKEALDLVQAERFDVILMDVQMPDMDGITATTLIRKFEQKAGVPRTPIIAMTANTVEDSTERCIAAGMDAYIGKPLKLNDLLRKISELLADRH